MISREEALAVLEAAIPAAGEIEEIPLEDGLDRVLAEDVAAPADQPPFDRAAMDGYAVRAADLATGTARLEVVGEVAAGRVFAGRVESGRCVKIMTGAPVPEGADAVVMVELSAPAGEGRVALRARPQPGDNVAPRGQDMRRGAIVVGKGTPLRPIELGMLAVLDRARLRVHRAPSVAVVPTGDELVPAGGGPLQPGQIRESNGVMLQAQVRAVGGGIRCSSPGIARDDEADLRARLDAALASDVVVLSGGVSMGERDLVGRELKRRGLEVRIEKVAMKPGKPLLFGRLEHGGRDRWVFGLPGNPVSSFVTFELFVRPFLRGLCGLPGPHVLELDAVLETDAGGRAIPRTQHLPARLAAGPDGLVVRTVRWNGSGDLAGLLAANAFVVVPADVEPPAAGARARVLAVDDATLRPPTGRERP